MAKPIADKIAAVKARKEKLAAELNTLTAKAKQQDRKRDARRKIVIGGAILAAIESDTALADRLGRLLAANVTRPADREVIADLLAKSGNAAGLAASVTAAASTATNSAKPAHAA